MQKSDYISDSRALDDVCAALSRAPWTAIDTEFMRERTYFAKPCLVQLATPDFVVLVDPLADLDIQPLIRALQREDLAKVFHSARQDLELFFDLSGEVLAPIFDTQIAAAFLGYDDQVSYATLVASVTGIELDKSQTRTDWAARPLRPEQLRYAEADVVHLRNVYAQVVEALTARGRLAWVEAECRRLARPEIYRSNPDTVHLRVKNGYQFPVEVQHVLRALLVWREAAARRENLPRNWVARDNELVAIAKSGTSDAAAISRLPGLTNDTAKRAEEMAVVLGEARAQSPAAAWPVPPQFDAAQTKVLQHLLVRVRERAQETGISAALLATRREIERLLAGERALPVLEDWRREVLGEELLTLIKNAG